MGTEIWKTPIVNGEPYENYQVSNFGRLMSLNYRRTGRAELLSPWEDTYGYLQVLFRKNGEYVQPLVHRIVAETFLPNPEEKPQVNHKIEGDEGKKINIVYLNEDGTVDEKKSTIEWVTSKENMNYGTINERISKTMTNGKTSKKVLQLSLDGELIREWPSTMECGRNGFCQSEVSKCCRGEKPQYKGFKWCYA